MRLETPDRGNIFLAMLIQDGGSIELRHLGTCESFYLIIIREIKGGSLEPNTVDALHLRLDWLHGLIARLVHL